MNEADIRSALDQHLRPQAPGGVDTLVRHEMGICNGARRIDVAVIGTRIDGYEIKSDDDTLARLEAQAADYGRVFDRLTLVTTDKHLRRATAAIPQWWGIILARNDDRSVQLETLREPQANTLTEPFATTQLLWRDEALEELKARNQARGLSKKPRHHVWTVLSELLPKEELTSLVRQKIMTRPDWRQAR